MTYLNDLIKKTANIKIINKSYDNDWIYTQLGSSVVYQKRMTLTGAEQTEELSLEKGIRLNRIEIFANDATAKSLSIRVYNGFNSSYVELVNIVSDINQSLTLLFENEVFPSIDKIAVVVTESTLNKTLDVNISVVEL